MKREEQSRLMYEKILISAVKEFNSYDYDAVSLNQICSKGEFSKGIIYHYFTDKDTLYLSCVQRCFETFFAYFKDVQFDSLDLTDAILEYIKKRMLFFQEHSEFRGLFFHALLRTPKHLEKEVGIWRKELDTINLRFLQKQLEKIDLQKFLSLDNAVSFLGIQLNAMNEYFRKEARNGENFEFIIEKHEKMIFQWINIILYGIVKEA